MFYLLNFSSIPENIIKRYKIDETIYPRDFYPEILDESLNRRIAIVNPDSEIRKYLRKRKMPLVEISPHGEKVAWNKENLLDKSFFQRDAREVAQALLGKFIIRPISKNLLMGKIVETEAYYGEKDPASRAYHGKKNYNQGMYLPGGHIFIYMVHANWMLNITTDMEEAQAVLIRAVEPVSGIEKMIELRKKKNLSDLCSGPGKLSQAFHITREMNQKPLGQSLIIMDSPWKKFEIRTSHRIGVREDLEEHLRFFISPNKFVSRKGNI